MADKIKADLGVSEVALLPGKKGEFTVWVGETVVAQKDYSGFPTEDAVVELVRAKLGD